jgi:DNA-binding MarR family transcriptional regulator
MVVNSHIYGEVRGVKTMQLDLEWAVLASISRLCEECGRFLGPTIEEVLEDLEKRYGVRYTRRHIEEIVASLEKRGLVQRKRGLLRDGRVTLLTTTKGERVALTLIRLNEKEALVHDGWEGIVYDPPEQRSSTPTPEDGQTCPRCLRGLLTPISPHVYFCTWEKVTLRVCPVCGNPHLGGVFKKSFDSFTCPTCGEIFTPCPKCGGWAHEIEDALVCVDCGFRATRLGAN